MDLKDVGIDLVAEARRDRLPVVRFRDAEIERALQYLDQLRSVLVIGPPGVGKTALVHGVARAYNARGKGGLQQVSTADIMAGTRFIGDWQTKITAILDAARESSMVLYFTDFLSLRTVGRTAHESSALLDAILPRAIAQEVSIVAEMRPEQLNQVDRSPDLTRLFERITCPQLSEDQVLEVIRAATARSTFDLDAASIRSLLEVTTRFGGEISQPAPALQLLRRVDDYIRQKEAIGEPEPISPRFIEKVFSVYSGLPLFIVSRDQRIPTATIRSELQDRIVGQRDAVEAVAEAITLFKAGLHDPDRPVGSFLFVGPTGVGKTEMAKATASLVFGSESRMLRFDMTEFKDYNSFEMLVGDPQYPERQARLLDPMRSQPFQVLLFDEFEKAHPNIRDLLLQLLDEGMVTPPTGKPVGFKNSIVIATSNVGAMDAPKSVGFGARHDRGSYAEKLRTTLELEFRPELLNRFQYIVVFHPLSRDEVRAIGRMELDRILNREGIAGRKLVVDVTDEALDMAIDRGFDARYGARALKREIQRQLVLPIATMLMERTMEPHTVIRVTEKDGKVDLRCVDTPDAGALRKVREPLVMPDGQRLSREQIAHLLAGAVAGIEVLRTDVDEASLEDRVRQLEELRTHPGFWDDPKMAMQVMREQNRHARVVDRTQRLRRWISETQHAWSAADTREKLEQLGKRVVRIERALDSARRELVVMAPDGYWDAIVEIRTVGRTAALARDKMTAVYRDWATGRHMEVDWICHPTNSDQPAVMAIKGHYATGYLTLESGLHRVRDGDTTAVASVRVGPWLDNRYEPEYASQQALKMEGMHGKRVRSRVVCHNGLVVQNERSLAENRDFAAELAPSWDAMPRNEEGVVRRYDLSPFRIRDVLTGVTSGRPGALGQLELHRLLCARIDLQA